MRPLGGINKPLGESRFLRDILIDYPEYYYRTRLAVIRDAHALKIIDLGPRERNEYAIGFQGG